MKEITVNSSKKYQVIIDSSLEKLKEYIDKQKTNKILIITDKNVFNLYYNEILSAISEKQVFCYKINGGEKSKNQKTAFDILDFLVKNNFSRYDAVITLGGGVVGDLGGFVASIFCRGIKLINIPTSLLAMVDSSVGGKTAINLKNGKNLCGTFYQPDFVFINLNYLQTLPKREMISGIGEIAKYKIITSGNIDLVNINEDTIYSCIKYKAEIVEQDEFDGGNRKLLNFGHTFGHAVERLSNFKLSHGECVLKGINLAFIISQNYFKYESRLYSEFLEFAKNNDINLDIQYNLNKIIAQLLYDKKRQGTDICLILIDKQNVPKPVNLKIENIKEYL